MRNLEYKELENSRKVMGYQYQLTKPEQLLNGGLTGVLAQMAKEKSFGQLAIELAASTLPSGQLAVCLNIRVYAETPQRLYELRNAACEGLQEALTTHHILYKKARFDDEGTVAQMPLSGYRYLKRCCAEKEDGTACVVSLKQVKDIPWEQVLSMVKNHEDSGFSIQWMPTVLTWDEMKYVKNSTSENEKYALYVVTAAFWGKAAMEVTNSIVYWTDGAVEPCVLSKDKSEYDNVTVNPWGLCEALGKGQRLPLLFSQLEMQDLMGEKQKEQKNQSVHRSHEETGRELKHEELKYLGISSEKELGMTKEQLNTLKDVIISIRPMGIFSGKVIEVDNYFSFIAMLGYFYELLMATCYYDYVYAPYARLIGQDDVVAEVSQTELACYEQGPIRGYKGALDDWSWNEMSQNLSTKAKFVDGYWTNEEWKTFFRDMRQIRMLRNQVHVLDKATNQIRFVSRTDAEDGIKKMLYGKKSLMRRILQCTACTISLRK